MPVERPTDCLDPNEDSSRKSASFAGWSASRDEYDPGPTTSEGWTWVRDDKEFGEWQGRLDALEDRKWRDFSWISARALLDSVNDQIAKLVHDVVNGRRMRWMARQRAAGMDREPFFPDLLIREPKADRFLIVGDPGEADGSQYAVVDPVLGIDRDKGSNFMVILSDVIYPAGDVNEYVNGFYVPYKGYEKPILALPGNHDWYDGLAGFMFNFCGAEPLPDTGYRGSSYTIPERIARRLWRQASRPRRTELLKNRARRHGEETAERWEPAQPGPYWALDMGDGVRLVAIDTGIGGTIDREQGEWLIRVSRDEPARAKVLLTGKPIWVDNDFRPTPIEWDGGALGPFGYETVDDIVRDPRNGYVAAIGGDIHNYQRYSVTVDNERAKECGKTERSIQYIVSGGGGAYMSPMQRFGRVHHTKRETEADAEERRWLTRQEDYTDKKVEFEPPESVQKPITENDFRGYPLRGDALAFYARSFGPRLFWTCISLLVLACFALATLLTEAFGGGIFGELEEQGVGWMLLACYGLIVAGALAAGITWLARKPARRGYRTAISLLVVPAALALLFVLLGEVWSAWEWIWKAILLTLATIAIPVVLTAVGYYGLGSQGPMARHLALATLVVALVALYVLEHVQGATAVVLVLAGGLLAIGWLLVLIARLDKWLKERRVQQGGREISWAQRIAELTGPYVLLLALLYVMPLAALAARFWDAWAVQVVVLAAIAFMLLLGLLFLLWLPFKHASSAVWKLREGRLDPDQAIRHLRQEYKLLDDAPGRQSPSVDERTKKICEFLMPPPWGANRVRKWAFWPIENMIAEAGNADLPPMFKSFLHVKLDGDYLEVSCYGVTGWRAHDGKPGHTVPREDCVRIPLEPAKQTAERLASRPTGLRKLASQAASTIGLGSGS